MALCRRCRHQAKTPAVKMTRGNPAPTIPAAASAPFIEWLCFADALFDA
jgi:hypothetical protein